MAPKGSPPKGGKAKIPNPLGGHTIDFESEVLPLEQL